MNLEEIGNRIKQLRTSLKLSRDDLARAAGVTEHAVGNWERGQTNLKGSSLIAVAALLKTSPTYILTGREPKPATDTINEPSAIYSMREISWDGPQTIPLLTKEKIRSLFESCDVMNIPVAWADWVETDVTGTQLFAVDLEDAEVLDSAYPITTSSKARLIVQKVESYEGDEARRTLLFLHRSSNQVLVKKVLQNGAERYLYSLNPQIPPARWDESYQAVGAIRKIEITL